MPDHKKLSRRILPVMLAVALMAVPLASRAEGPWSKPRVHASPDSILTVHGSGLAPNQPVLLSAGKDQQLTATTDRNGEVTFQGLKYTPSENLKLGVTFGIQGEGYTPIPNTINVDMNPYTGAVLVKGRATKAASIVVNLSSEDSRAMVANQDGFFQGSTFALTGLSTGSLKFIASIVNVDQSCCPRSFKPFAPATISIQGSPLKTPAPAPAKKAALDLREKIETVSIEKDVSLQSYAISSALTPATVPADLMETTWVDAFAKFGNQIVETMMAATTAWGTFFDAQNNINSITALQKRQAQTAIKYLPSEQLCRFGTLGQGLAASEAISGTNKNILAQALLGREMGTTNTLFGKKNGSTAQGRAYQIVNAYCDKSDFRKMCRDNDDDTQINADIDYTSRIDAPLTLDMDLSNSTGPDVEKDESVILSLADNIFPAQPVGDAYKTPGYAALGSEYRSQQAIRSVARNTMISQLAEKTKGSAKSAPYIASLLKSLGVSAGAVQSLMGSNPSYYAQMEVLTKKLYQDPTFYVNLVDTPSNVERQRASIRAIKLQQGADLAETVKRREMLLAVLLEMKLREKADKANQRLINANKAPAKAYP